MVGLTFQANGLGTESSAGLRGAGDRGSGSRTAWDLGPLWAPQLAPAQTLSRPKDSWHFEFPSFSYGQSVSQPLDKKSVAGGVDVLAPGASAQEFGEVEALGFQIHHCGQLKILDKV